MNGVTITIHDEITDVTQSLTSECRDGTQLALIVARTTTRLAPGQHITSIDVA